MSLRHQIFSESPTVSPWTVDQYSSGFSQYWNSSDKEDCISPLESSVIIYTMETVQDLVVWYESPDSHRVPIQSLDDLGYFATIDGKDHRGLAIWHIIPHIPIIFEGPASPNSRTDNRAVESVTIVRSVNELDILKIKMDQDPQLYQYRPYPSDLIVGFWKFTLGNFFESTMMKLNFKQVNELEMCERVIDLYSQDDLYVNDPLQGVLERQPVLGCEATFGPLRVPIK